MPQSRRGEPAEGGTGTQESSESQRAEEGKEGLPEKEGLRLGAVAFGTRSSLPNWGLPGERIAWPQQPTSQVGCRSLHSEAEQLSLRSRELLVVENALLVEFSHSDQLLI